MIRSAIVPVAGYGTRLLPATKSQPKEMLTVARKPIVQYVAEELVANGLSQILFVTSRNKTSIENHFDSDPELMRMLKEANKSDLLDGDSRTAGAILLHSPEGSAWFRRCDSLRRKFRGRTTVRRSS